MLIIVVRGWMLAFHPFFFPLISALVVAMTAPNSAVGIALGLLQVVIGYANYWCGWLSFGILFTILERVSG